MDSIRRVLIVVLLALIPTTAFGQRLSAQPKPCEELNNVPGLVWQGTSPTMTLQQLASYAAPLYWMSPDEPTMNRAHGPDLRVPAAFPFETKPDHPVVYYQLDDITGRTRTGEPVITSKGSSKGDSVIDLRESSILHLHYITYFPFEAGVGQHLHDVEPTEMRILIASSTGPIARQYGYQCTNEFYLIMVKRVTGEAHGNPWYYNVLDVDRETTLPIHLLIEEGKHASATDKNGDGYFTPGYDVSVRPNDAWGVRDTIRGGTLFTGAFNAWMAKVRRPEHRVLPPLPADSRLRAQLIAEVGNLADFAQYELRPLPSSDLATDPLLHHKIQEKEVVNWPEVNNQEASGARLWDWYTEGRDLRPVSFAYAYDGDPGFSVSLPLLIFKTVHEPLTGGYLVHRFTFKDTNLSDVDWMVMYMPSASRWFDKYAAMGLETDRSKDEEGHEVVNRDFAFELGVKFRFRAPVKVARVVNFWGVRLGIRNVGAVQIDHMKYVIEFGLGVW